jgi:hypothetical protein
VQPAENPLSQLPAFVRRIVDPGGNFVDAFVRPLVDPLGSGGNFVDAVINGF